MRRDLIGVAGRTCHADPVTIFTAVLDETYRPRVRVVGRVGIGQIAEAHETVGD